MVGNVFFASGHHSLYFLHERVILAFALHITRRAARLWRSLNVTSSNVDPWNADCASRHAVWAALYSFKSSIVLLVNFFLILGMCYEHSTPPCAIISFLWLHHTRISYNLIKIKLGFGSCLEFWYSAILAINQMVVVFHETYILQRRREWREIP